MTTLVVGDIHGCAEELRELLDRVRPQRLVCVGDLFTKGPDPFGVYEQVCTAEAVLGNHDERLLRVLAGGRKRDDHAREVIGRLDHGDPAWRDWLRSVPLTRAVGRFTVVHAALPRDGGPPPRETAVFLRRYADQAEGRRWWQDYHGPPVIFGHDAIRGLVRVERGGRPWVVGLDSGCVYGGHLSGYVVEEDRLVSVRAQRVYRRAGRVGSPPQGATA